MELMKAQENAGSPRLLTDKHGFAYSWAKWELRWDHTKLFYIKGIARYLVLGSFFWCKKCLWNLFVRLHRGPSRPVGI